MLAERGDGEDAKRAWGIWLSRLRRFPLRGKDATADDLKIARVAAGCERLNFIRRRRAFTSGKKGWWGTGITRNISMSAVF